MYFSVNVLSSPLNLDGCSWQCFWLVLRALSINGVILSTIDINLMPVSNCVTFKVELNIIGSNLLRQAKPKSGT
jgi:hypothetical protein